MEMRFEVTAETERDVECPKCGCWMTTTTHDVYEECAGRWVATYRNVVMATCPNVRCGHQSRDASRVPA